MVRLKNTNKYIVQKIRLLYFEENMTQKNIAIQFNLSQSTICKIVNNNIHKYHSVNISGNSDIKIGYKYGN